MTFTYTDSEFNTSKGGFKTLNLEKTDRNGTRYYTGTRSCWKCNGSRYFDCWSTVSNGVCFACNGSGINGCNVKVMTDEHAEKLADNRKKRAEKKFKEECEKAVKLNAEFLKKAGFSADGFAWVVYGDTYPIREELKNKGAHYYARMWFFSEPHDEYDCIKVSADGCFNKSNSGCYNTWKLDDEMKKAVDARREAEKKSVADKTEYFGSVGDKVDGIAVTLTKSVSFETQFGWMGIYTFEDDAHHVFVWKTASGIDAEKGDKLTIKFSIKEHSVYDDVKQTVVTRVKKVA